MTAELEREKLRIFDAIVWAAVALLFIGLGLLLLAALLVMLAPEPMRPWLLTLMALACLGGWRMAGEAGRPALEFTRRAAVGHAR